MTNKLIIVEGLPCSGKSTTAKFIAEQLGFSFVDEGAGNHPSDYECHAHLTDNELKMFSDSERNQIAENCEIKSGGYIVKLENSNDKLFEKLLKYKIYDFLPWEKEKPLMLDKWREFVQNNNDNRYVFNCVFLQNPMCETMMRFGFSEEVSFTYISEITEIIKPLAPVIVYLKNNDIYDSVKKASAERGDEWLRAVIDYHCDGEYGKQHKLTGVDGYIDALKERQRREIAILSKLDIESIVLDNPQHDWNKAYLELITKLRIIGEKNDNFTCN